MPTIGVAGSAGVKYALFLGTSVPAANHGKLRVEDASTTLATCIAPDTPGGKDVNSPMVEEAAILGASAPATVNPDGSEVEDEASVLATCTAEEMGVEDANPNRLAVEDALSTGNPDKPRTDPVLAFSGSMLANGVANCAEGENPLKTP